VNWKVVTDILNLLVPEGGGTVILKNSRNYLPINVA
jgi:hypothetical protein